MSGNFRALVTRGPDGERRRMCDLLAAAPWAVLPMQYHPEYEGERKTIQGANIEFASKLMSGHTPVLFADEVAEPLRWGGPKMSDEYLKSPGAMPPYEVMMVESRTPPHDHDILGHATIAAVYKPEEYEAFGLPERSAVLNCGAVRIVQAVQWFQLSTGALLGPVCGISYPIGEDHRVVFRDGSPVVAVKEHGIVPGYSRKSDLAPFGDAVLFAWAVFVRACSLANASNVKMIQGGTTNEGRSRKAIDRDRLATISYHVLRLKRGNSLVPLPRSAGGGDGESGIKMPLHMVRGHFRDYSKGKGLFGRLRGEKYAHVWVPSFAAGDADEGVVVKDYNITVDK